MYFLEFPQNVLGWLAFNFYTKIYKRPFYNYQKAYVNHVKGRWGAISLSRYIFADDVYFQSEMIKHEYGHTLQSEKLLFLYLLVIGLPSFVWNKFFKDYRKRNHRSYYAFYTEAWANKLGEYQK